MALLATACGAGDSGSADATTTTVPIVTSTNPPASDSVAEPSESGGRDPAAEPGSGFTAESLAPGDDPAAAIADNLAGPIEPALARLVERAVDDLSQRLGVPAADITVLRAEAVVWPDSSRGCPQPGMSYLMVLTDGAWIVLAHDGTVYEYHTDAVGNVALCENDAKQRPVEGKSPGFGDS
jgi:hypothetical protein